MFPSYFVLINIVSLDSVNRQLACVRAASVCLDAEHRWNCRLIFSRLRLYPSVYPMQGIRGLDLIRRRLSSLARST